MLRQSVGIANKQSLSTIKEIKMKEIKAYIRPEQVDDVILALEKVGIHGMTIIDVYALAQWTDPRRARFSTKYVEKYSKVVKFELICPAAEVDAVVEAIRSAGRTGHQGDGKIFISDIDEAISIRTGERGDAAI